jgi:SSS family solute:Na+ symporter
MFAAIGVGALVPAAIMSIAAANLFTRTIYRGYLRPNASPKEETTVSKIVSLTVKIGAVLVILLLDTQFAIDLQLIGGVFIMQTLPAVAIGLYTAWLHRWALVAGVVTGIATGLVMLYQVRRYGGPDGTTVVREHFGGSAWPLSNLGLETRSTIYVGVVALAVNLIVAVLLTPLMRGVARDGTDVTHPADYVADEGELQRMSELVDGTPDGDDDQRRIDVPPRRTPSTYVPRRSAGPPRPYR